MTTPRAVLFDFSGTLFRFEEQPEWFADLHDEAGRPLHVEAQAELMRRMTQPVGLRVDLADEDRIAWENRDLDPVQHRQAYLAILRASGLSTPGHAESLYGRLLQASSWAPFPDTVAVLRGLRAAGIPTAVVSNIAFDLRDVLAMHGVIVDAVVLSYEVGSIKPNPLIFGRALDLVGVAGPDALMIGDSAAADGGAAHLGCVVEIVEDAPTALRPRALLDALAAHGIVL